MVSLQGTGPGSTAQPILITPLTAEEEDQIIPARITNDERPLRRVIKKFHSYTSLSHAPLVPQVIPEGSTAPISVEDAREAFLVELASFQLSLKKGAMICEAEARQVEEYQRERQRIDSEHETLRAQIEELKVALEQAQILRRRKIEYDHVAEKVNTLPSRNELEQSIQALENDLFAIHSEHETQNRTIQGHKAALDGIITELSSLRFMGKDRDTVSAIQSPRASPAPDVTATNGMEGIEGMEITNTENAEKEDGEEKPLKDGVMSSASGDSVEDDGVEDGAVEDGAVEEDIEMGEVEEQPREKNKKKLREELEEGEASDASSELSEPPDDVE